MLEEGSYAGDSHGFWCDSRAAIHHGCAGCALMGVAEAEPGAFCGWVEEQRVRIAEFGQDVVAEGGFDGESLGAGVSLPSFSGAYVPALFVAAAASPWFPGCEEESG